LHKNIDNNETVNEIPGSSELFHKKISHPAKFVGQQIIDGKIYNVFPPLRTSNHNGEKLFNGVKMGEIIPKEQVLEFRMENESSFQKLIDSQMIEYNNSDYIRTFSSWMYGELGDQSLIPIGETSNGKIQLKSSYYLHVESKEVQNYMCVHKNLTKISDESKNNILDTCNQESYSIDLKSKQIRAIQLGLHNFEGEIPSYSSNRIEYE